MAIIGATALTLTDITELNQIITNTIITASTTIGTISIMIKVGTETMDMIQNHTIMTIRAIIIGIHTAIIIPQAIATTTPIGTIESLIISSRSS